MDISAHVAAVLGYFPFIVVLPAAVAIICNRIAAARRHPAILFASCGFLALVITLLLSKAPGSTFKGIDLAVAGVLSALCFVVPHLRATNHLTKETSALLRRETFLLTFAGLSVYFLSGDASTWGYGLLAALCIASAVLLWRSPPLAKYPLYAAILYLAVGALVGGIYNYIHDPTLLQKPMSSQIISWLIPGIPSGLLVNCCLYARRISRGKDFLGR